MKIMHVYHNQCTLKPHKCYKKCGIIVAKKKKDYFLFIVTKMHMHVIQIGIVAAMKSMQVKNEQKIGIK